MNGADTAQGRRPYRAGADLSQSIVAGAAIACLLAFAAAAVHAILTLGPWYDEFFTYYVARPVVSWREALVAHWLPDNHPPLYYALARTTWWIGDTLEHKRLLNILLMAATVAGAVVLVRPRPDLHRLAALGGIALAAQDVVLRYASDYRSYFLSVCAMALLVLALASVHASAGVWRRRDSLVLWIAAFAALNVHITTTIVATAIQLPFLLRYLLARDATRFRRLAAPSLAGGLLFTLVSAIQARHWLANTGAFWLPSGWSVARWTIEILSLGVAFANPLLLAGAMVGAALAAVALVRRQGQDAQRDLALFLAAGWVLAVAIIVAIHAWRPFIYERYLLGLVPVMTMLLAIAAEQMLARIDRRLATTLVVLASLVSVTAVWRAAATRTQNGDWTPSAALVGATAASCRDTRVHLDLFWNREAIEPPPPDNRRVVPFAYRTMAARHSFDIEAEASRAISSRCPTLFWAEWTRPKPWPAREILARIRARGFAIDRIRLYRFGRSFVAVADPVLL